MFDQFSQERHRASEQCNQKQLFRTASVVFGNLFAVRYPASGTGIGMSTYTGALAAKTAEGDMAD